MLVFEEGGKLENQDKSLGARGEPTTMLINYSCPALYTFVHQFNTRTLGLIPQMTYPATRKFNDKAILVESESKL